MNLYIILIILLLFTTTNNFRYNPLFKYIISVAISSILFQNIFNKWNKSIIAGVVFVYFLRLCNNTESFENTLSEKEMKDILDDDNDEEKYNNNKSPDKLTPAQAQRETFRMINTVKQLEETMKSMAPTIMEGKKILEAVDKMKF